jgi:site-specific recombinase XerD
MLASYNPPWRASGTLPYRPPTSYNRTHRPARSGRFSWQMVPNTSRRPSEPPSLDLLECLFEYAASYFRLRNFSHATRRGYLSDQLLFVRYLKATRGISRVTDVERDHIVGYLSQAERRGLCGRTRARKLGALRSFFGYLEEAGRIRANPARGIPRPKQETNEPRVLTEGEYGRLRAAAADPRGRAVIELFLQTGIRLSEASKLTRDDVGLPETQDLPAIGWLRVLGKGRKERTVTLNSRACEALSAYLGTRSDFERGAPLFVSRKGSCLSPRGIQRVVRKLMKSAGITGASVHTLRHIFATHTVRKGTNLRVVQEALGHSSLHTTSRYVSLARELMDQQLEANAL